MFELKNWWYDSVHNIYWGEYNGNKIRTGFVKEIFEDDDKFIVQCIGRHETLIEYFRLAKRHKIRLPKSTKTGDAL